MTPARYGSGAAGGGSRAVAALRRFGGPALALAAFIWLCVLSAQVNSLRDSYNHAQTSVTALAASLSQRFSFAAPAAAPVPAGAAVSLDWGAGGPSASVQSVALGVGTTAYLGAQQLTVPVGQLVKHTKAIAVDADLTVLVGTVQAGAGVVGAAAALSPNGGGDWVSGATVSLALGSASVARLPFTPMDAALLSVTPLNAGGVAATVLLVSGGSACVLTATRVSAGGPVSFSTSTPSLYTPNVVQDVQVAPLSPSTFALSYYDMDATSSTLYVLRTLAGSVTGSGPSAAVSFGSPATYASDHETHLIVPLSSSQWLLAFPADNATSATDDDEASGYPLGVAVATLNSAAAGGLGVNLWGAGGMVAKPGLVPPVPWLARYVHAHGYFSGVALSIAAGSSSSVTVPRPGVRGGAVDASASTSASALVAFADAGLGDALRALVVTVFTTPSSATPGATPAAVDVFFGDSLAATPKGATGRYRSFVAAAFAPVGGAQDVALVTADVAGGGGVTTSLVRVSAPLMSLAVVLRSPLPTYTLPSGSDPAGMADYAWLAAAVLPPASSSSSPSSSRPASLLVATLLSLDGATSIGNVTLVERRHHPAGIAVGPAPATGAALPVATGFVDGGVTAHGAWLGPLPSAGGAVYGTSRGNLVGASSVTAACVQPLGAATWDGACSVTADLAVAADEGALGVAADGAGSVILVPQTPGVAHVGGNVGVAAAAALRR